jgi:ATP-binding cassette, subfamily B, bacterial
MYRQAVAGSFRQGPAITRQRLRPGTVRRIFAYARPYRAALAFFFLATVLNAVITVASPLLLRAIIDRGIIPRDEGLVIGLALAVAGLAVLDAGVSFLIRWFASWIGQCLTYDLRTEVFAHVQQQPIAFFTRAQTGSLVSRLNSDVIGAQQAITSVMSSLVSNVLSVVAILLAMFYLSWVITIIGLVLIPAFLWPARLVGRRLQRLTREAMQQDAALGALMTDRFNVAGAMLVKLFGRPREEAAAFAARAAQVRDIRIRQTVISQVFFIALSLLAALAAAAVYGAGGVLVIRHAFPLGTLVALAALLTMLYAPITQLSGVQVSVMTALVSFDRVFEVLDLKPLIADQPGAATLRPATPGPDPGAPGPGGAPEIVFDGVCFRYPTASEITLASLESIARPAPERSGQAAQVLREVSFRVRPGQLTALVGPSGAGKTTITHLAARLYDPDSGVVRIGGRDLRQVTLESLHDVVGVVSQDAHLFHDTIRANLAYARPDAREPELVAACRAAQIWDLISSLPDGLDTVAGDRGYRLSGGEKQRVALARLLLKAPPVVVLDEATAHLDSESEAAVQRALRSTLAGRTSLVIAHRLSTIREADQILVIDGGRVTQAGTHEELLTTGGLYADLYRTQFAGQQA